MCLLLVLFAVVIFNDAGDVSAGLGEWRDAAILLDSLRPGVIGCQCFQYITVVLIQQLAQRCCSACHVRDEVRVNQVPRGGSGNQTLDRTLYGKYGARGRRWTGGRCRGSRGGLV